MPSRASAAPSGSKVLLVDDESIIRELLAEVLRDHGIGVIEAASADEAWSYLESGGTADAVFSDVAMPGSMNGIDLIRRIRDVYPSIRTVLTSGHGSPPRTGGAGLFLAKPFRLETVAKLLLGVLRQPAT